MGRGWGELRGEAWGKWEGVSGEGVNGEGVSEEFKWMSWACVCMIHKARDTQG